MVVRNSFPGRSIVVDVVGELFEEEEEVGYVKRKKCRFDQKNKRKTKKTPKKCYSPRFFDVNIDVKRRNAKKSKHCRVEHEHVKRPRRQTGTTSSQKESTANRLLC